MLNLRRFLLLAGVVSVLCVACRTLNPLAPVDLSQAGWRVYKGQAIWKSDQKRPELTGEFMLATNASGNLFVQFTKDPFPLVTAQVAGDRWEIIFGANKSAWRGSGEPPNRFAWFQLPRLLAGEKATGAWRFKKEATRFHLGNFRTGEMLEGEIFP